MHATGADENPGNSPMEMEAFPQNLETEVSHFDSDSENGSNDNAQVYYATIVVVLALTVQRSVHKKCTVFMHMIANKLS